MTTSLMDDLTEYLGLMYVSDLLQLSSKEKRKCIFFLKFIDDSDVYSLHEWNDACSYISHNVLNGNDSPEDAKNNLIKWLNE